MSMYQSSVVISGYFSPICLAQLQELAVRGLDDVGFGDDGHAVFVVFAAQNHRRARAMRCGAVGGGDGEVHGQMPSSRLERRSEPRVYAPSVFSRKNVQSMPCSGTFTGPYVGEQIQLLAHGNVGAFDVGPFVACAGGGGRPFQDDVACLQFGQHVVGDGLACARRGSRWSGRRSP